MVRCVVMLEAKAKSPSFSETLNILKTMNDLHIEMSGMSLHHSIVLLFTSDISLYLLVPSKAFILYMQ